jgi:hypothetical protein
MTGGQAVSAIVQANFREITAGNSDQHREAKRGGLLFTSFFDGVVLYIIAAAGSLCSAAFSVKVSSHSVPVPYCHHLRPSPLKLGIISIPGP